jgi:hypothetical protein
VKLVPRAPSSHSPTAHCNLIGEPACQVGHSSWVASPPRTTCQAKPGQPGRCRVFCGCAGGLRTKVSKGCAIYPSTHPWFKPRLSCLLKVFFLRRRLGGPRPRPMWMDQLHPTRRSAAWGSVARRASRRGHRLVCEAGGRWCAQLLPSLWLPDAPPRLEHRLKPPALLSPPPPPP